MSPSIRRLTSSCVALSLLAGSGALLAACGGDEQTMARPEDPRKNRRKKGAKKKAADPAALVVVELKNPQWDLISAHYKKFLAQKHTTPKDAFKPQILKYIPKPTLDDDDNDGSEIEAIEEEEPRGPLQQYPVTDYELLLIMSGTAVPKAVIVDPKSEAYVIQRDTRLGDKGGIVESITQYMVVVKEPNTEEPTKLTIKPPYIDLVSQVGFELGSASSAQEEEFAVPPGADLPSSPTPGPR